MSLDQAITTASQNVPECVAAGYVDMTTGMLLSVKTVDSHPSQVLELVSAATADLFQGANVTAIEQLFKRSRGISEDNHHYFQEIMVYSDDLIHVFLRGKNYTDHAAVFVCRKNANLGMVLTKARMQLATLEAAL